MLARQRTAVVGHEVGGLLHEGSVAADADCRPEVEVDAGVDAAIAEVPVEGAAVSEAVQEAAEVAQVVAQTLGRDGGVLPPLPRAGLVGHQGGGAEARLPHLPHRPLLGRVLVELHGRCVARLVEVGHEAAGQLVGLLLGVGPELHEQPAAPLRQQAELTGVHALGLHV